MSRKATSVVFMQDGRLIFRRLATWRDVSAAIDVEIIAKDEVVDSDDPTRFEVVRKQLFRAMSCV